MAELEEAEVVMSPPTKSPSNKVQDLQAKGDVLAKAWMDLFSSVTEYQAELALKESLLDIAEMEIATRKKQQEEMRTVIEGGDEAVAKLQNEMAAKETERLQMQLELKTKEQLLESVQSDLKNSKQSNETLQSDVAAKERQLQHIQLELNSKEQLLQSVQSDLKNCKLLNEKFNQKKSELMGSQTEIASLKSDLIMKNSLYTKLSEEHEELKHDLDIQVKTVELERKSLEMERKAHDMTKRSLVYASGNRSPSAPLKVKTDDSNDHEDGMDNGMDDEDGNVVSDVASPSTSPEKPMRVSKRKKNPSARVIAPKPDASPKTVRFVVRKGGKGNIVSLASSSSPGSSTEPMVTQPSQTTSTDTPASTSEVYFPLTLSVTSSAGGGDVEDMVLVNEAATSESAPGTPMGGPPTKKSMIRARRDLRDPGSTRDAWTAADMTMAINDVQNGVLNLRQAARQYNLPKTTLADRVKGRIKSFVNPPDTTSVELSREDELKIHDYIIQQEKIGHVVTKTRVQEYASRLVADMGRTGTYDFGDEWYRSLFLRVRHSGAWKSRRKRIKKEMFDC
ncbi:uncharacterized protein LOC135487808 isoform X2 [Lineus longissimus]|uniref:uncharacterized protein LOC135487808 isoform X2 n=1 Tax=Lineus longissimus TaxID=88925 RepID=UPI002B4CD73B